MENDWWKTFFDRDFLPFNKDRPYQDTEEELNLLRFILGERGKGRLLLDACCGPGRHAIPLSRDGWRVVGLDRSAPLLKTALGQTFEEEDRAMAPSWVRADLRCPPFRPAFRAAISMWTSIGYFEQDSENRRMIEAVYESLRPGGVFVLDLANRDCLLQRPDTLKNWWRRGDSFFLEETKFDPTTSVATTRNVMVTGNTTKETAFRVRLYSLHEITRFLLDLGFTIREGYGGYGRQPLLLASPRMILAAEKAR